MRKYLYEFRLSLLCSFEYRFNTIVNLFFSNVGIIITLLFWGLIYAGSGNSNIQGFSLSDMVTYFILSSIFREFILSSSGFEVSNIIKSGKLSSYLLKPYNVNLSIYSRGIAGVLTNIFPQILIVLLFLPVLASHMSWRLEVQNVFFVIVFLFISAASSHLLWSLLGYSAFILEDANSVMWLFAVLFNLVTGAFIPLDFFPTWAMRFLQFLPFSSWGYIPVKLYLNMYTLKESFIMLVVHCCWILLLLLFNKFFWKKGTKHYTAVGG